MNNVILIGRAVRNPELRYIPSGTATTNFTVAIDRQLSKEKKQELESRNLPTADFIKITTWGKMAENVANYLVKGRLVAIQGRIQTGSYEDKDGKRVYTTEVVANQVKFLEWGDRQDTNREQGTQEGDFPDLEGLYPVDNDDIPF